MKTTTYYLLLLATLMAFASCNKLSYKKTKTGLLYKIIPASGSDSIARTGDWIKIHYIQTRNNDKGDSILQSNFGKMPVYEQVAAESPTFPYNPAEIFHLLKKGDSAVVVMLVDSIVSKKLVGELPPFLKKGDQLTLKFRVDNVFRNDSTYRSDYQAEYTKNLASIEKDRAEQMAKQQKAQMEEEDIKLAEIEKSGQAASERKVVETYLAARKISAQKVGKGTYVAITQHGTGPAAAIGKYVTVKYTGKVLATDSTFESNVYPLQLGVDPVIAGWTEGLQAFHEGDKGTLYIPGYRGYGKNIRPDSPFGPDAALIFDVEILKVSDTPPQR
jgi:FKBP-type peptidyl-prolyl cis-trans isomerase